MQNVDVRGAPTIDKNFRHGYVCAHVRLVGRCLSLAFSVTEVALNSYQCQGNARAQLVRKEPCSPAVSGHVKSWKVLLLPIAIAYGLCICLLLLRLPMQ